MLFENFQLILSILLSKKLQGEFIMTKTQALIWYQLAELDGETVVKLLVNFYGEQLLTEELLEYLDQELSD